MASNAISSSQPLILVFNGEKYEFWSIKMKTLFKSQDLWDLIENGYSEPDDDEARLKENKKKDSKALFFIQQAVHENIFSRIMGATTSKEAWRILQKEFQGDAKVIAVKLQSLRRDFETSVMKTDETVQDFLSRVSVIVSKMRSFGEQCRDQTVVSKILRSLTPKFDHVVAAIEESKDLAIFSFDELMGSLQAHEARLNRATEQTEEKAFHVKGETSYQQGISDYNNEHFWSRGRGGFRSRGFRGRGRGQVGDWQRQSVQCHYCKRYGHIKANCRKMEKQANYAEEAGEEDEEEFKLFMARSEMIESSDDTWFLDSGCSNHMTSLRFLFKELDESYKIKVRMGDDKQMQVEGKGIVAISSGGNVKLLHNVLFVPKLTQNLLSV